MPVQYTLTETMTLCEMKMQEKKYDLHSMIIINQTTTSRLSAKIVITHLTSNDFSIFNLYLNNHTSESIGLSYCISCY